MRSSAACVAAAWAVLSASITLALASISSFFAVVTRSSAARRSLSEASCSLASFFVRSSSRSLNSTLEARRSSVALAELRAASAFCASALAVRVSSWKSVAPFSTRCPSAQWAVASTPSVGDATRALAAALPSCAGSAATLPQPST